MKGGIELLAEQVADEVYADIKYIHFRLENAFDSPIENLMFMAITSRIGRTLNCAFRHWNRLVGNLPTEEQWEQCIPKDDFLFVCSQVYLLDWPVDFVVCCGAGMVVVECDGHDFHERTKEQAARDRGRDRAVQAAGYEILRFTGSEIYRDPLKCADEVLRLLVAKREG